VGTPTAPRLAFWLFLVLLLGWLGRLSRACLVPGANSLGFSCLLGSAGSLSSGFVTSPTGSWSASRSWRVGGGVKGLAQAAAGAEGRGCARGCHRPPETRSAAGRGCARPTRAYKRSGEGRVPQRREGGTDTRKLGGPGATEPEPFTRRGVGCHTGTPRSEWVGSRLSDCLCFRVSHTAGCLPLEHGQVPKYRGTRGSRD
jgi:hypothetical protein